jgi:hypothetical protein
LFKTQYPSTCIGDRIRKGACREDEIRSHFGNFYTFQKERKEGKAFGVGRKKILKRKKGMFIGGHLRHRRREAKQVPTKNMIIGRESKFLEKLRIYVLSFTKEFGRTHTEQYGRSTCRASKFWYGRGNEIRKKL